MDDHTSPRIREIPYNYTSFSDREIILRFLGEQAWQSINALRGQRRTGRSARMLFEVLGDMWVVQRNPYIQEDLLSNRKRRQALSSALHHRITQIKRRADNNKLVLQLTLDAEQAIRNFNQQLDQQADWRQQLQHRLAKKTAKHNVCFDGFSRVSHATDATDWRVEMPLGVFTPDSESELAAILNTCMDLDLPIIPRGGGTGYTGSAVPLHAHSMVLNSEKLDAIESVKLRDLPELDQPVATIRVEAGAVTADVAARVVQAGYVFAVDPTSQDASTIGGNIAMNAGGKKAVLWGTTLDNLASWRMLVPDQTGRQVEWLEIERLNHNLGKIHLQPTVRFRLTRYQVDGKTPLANQTPIELSMAGSCLRKRGLGKDVTDKLLQAIPGVQKEGCDGLISSAVFIVHQQATYMRTVCLEFFGTVRDAVPAITETIAYLEQQPDVVLAGLEHLDERYIKAVRYSTKSARGARPRMLLLADIASDDDTAVETAAQAIVALSLQRAGEGFIARTAAARQKFWAERKRTAAIATHTNAFKINEDVVIPLPKLADYSDGIERINIEQSILNKLNILKGLEGCLNASPDTWLAIDDVLHDDKTIIQAKLAHAQQHVAEVKDEWQSILDHLDQPLSRYPTLQHVVFQAADQAAYLDDSLFECVQSRMMRISYHRSIDKILQALFSGDSFVRLREQFTDNHQHIRASRLFVALHMHAGDGNVHTNIPVNSHDYMMLQTAEQLVERIMTLTRALGGVISGEHGIGITKWRFLEAQKQTDFIKYKQKVDPNAYFNRGKLVEGGGLEHAYTPSLRLLAQEALILEATELGELNTAIKDCLRCGKCKPKCTTHVPRANLLYSPRNKILATGLLIEAVLYEEQTRRGISIDHYDAFNDIADHCTICHRCLNPCPVDIDFGDVTVKMRAILKTQGKRKFNIVQWLAMQFLNRNHPTLIRVMRLGLIQIGYVSQRFSSWAARKSGLIKPQNSARLPPGNTSRDTPIHSQIVHFMRKPLPTKFPSKPLRQILKLEDDRKIPILHDPKKTKTSEAVFYFPGCGSERLFSQIGLASLAMLYESGVQTVLPPGYLCCGYPQTASGDTQQGQKIITANRVLFHRLANTLNYLDIKTVLVSCGTCLDQLLKYEFEQIFPNCRLMDIHEFLMEKGFALNNDDSDENTPYLYHEPCHSPMKHYDPLKVASTLLGQPVSLADRCCGESGTFAIASPDIATQVRFRKQQELEKNLLDLGVDLENTAGKKQKRIKVLTSCPSCQQGLARYRDDLPISTDYIVVEFAQQFFGQDWQDQFVRKLETAGIEQVLL